MSGIGKMARSKIKQQISQDLNCAKLAAVDFGMKFE